MPGHPDLWCTEPDGVLAAETGRYRLAVLPPERPGGLVRFLVLRRDVLRRDGGSREALTLIGSGSEADRRTAMRAAARMADRLSEPPSRRPAL